jgi:hypothetical protein
VNLSVYQGNATAASIYYRNQNELAFTELKLTLTGQTAQGQLSAEKVKYPKLEYYLSIKMNNGSLTIMPLDGPSKPATVPVEAVQHLLRIPGQTGALQKKTLILKWND